MRHILNQPGKQTQNAYIESFNGKFRDKCLSEHWLQSLAQARVEIARWRANYNEVRPHSSGERMPPARFAALQRQTNSSAVLPPYSPELNRIEKLWHKMKYEWLAFKARDTQTLEADVDVILQGFGKDYRFTFC